MTETQDNIIDVKTAKFLKYCAELCEASYRDNENEVVKFLKYCSDKFSSDHSTEALGIFKFESGSAIVLVSKLNHPKEGKLKTITVAFQGTHNAGEVFEDVESINSKELKMLDNSGIEYSLEAGSGFIDYWESIKIVKSKDSDKTLFDLLKEGGLNYNNIIFTGHSLGGGVAQVAAIDYYKSFAENLGIKVFVTTFGSPRTFTIESAKKITTDIPFEMLRVVNEGDPITKIPITGVNVKFQHIGVAIGFDIIKCRWVEVNNIDFSGFAGEVGLVTSNVENHLLLYKFDKDFIDLFPNGFKYSKDHNSYILRLENHIRGRYINDVESCGCHCVIC